MDERVLPHGVDDDIAHAASGSVRGAAPCGMAVCVEVRHRTISAVANAFLLTVTLSACAGLIAGCTGEREIVASRLCDGTPTIVAAVVLCGCRGR
jgi:hypothetical protein